LVENIYSKAGSLVRALLAINAVHSQEKNLRNVRQYWRVKVAHCCDLRGPCRGEQVAHRGDVIMQVSFGLGVMLISLMMMSDMPKPNLVLESRVSAYLALFDLL